MLFPLRKSIEEGPRARNKSVGMSPFHLSSAVGVTTFHDEQQRMIEALVAGRDALMIVRTGFGKTAVFQAAGLAIGGVTVVVYPLRALIADQLDRFQRLGIPARPWNSDCSNQSKDETVHLLRSGYQGFILTTPESLDIGGELAALLRGRVNLVAIDEVHYVEQAGRWRHAYHTLGTRIRNLEPRNVFACTATLLRADEPLMIRAVGLRDPFIVRMPIARENLRIQIASRSPDHLIELLRRHRGQAGMVFFATTAGVDRMYSRLRNAGWKVARYHGTKMGVAVKREQQAGFMAGMYPVMLATNAFGLGIDKADVRWCAHYDPPATISEWVQEFGRCGRDGAPAAVYGLFCNAQDGIRARKFLIESEYPPLRLLKCVWMFLLGEVGGFRGTAGQLLNAAVRATGDRTLENAGSASSVAGWLKRKHLLETQRADDTGFHRLIYRACGDIETVNWADLEQKRGQALARFQDLLALAKLPETAIAGAISAYFGDDVEDSTEIRR